MRGARDQVALTEMLARVAVAKQQLTAQARGLAARAVADRAAELEQMQAQRDNEVAVLTAGPIPAALLDVLQWSRRTTAVRARHAEQALHEERKTLERREDAHDRARARRLGAERAVTRAVSARRTQADAAWQRELDDVATARWRRAAEARSEARDG